MTLSSRRRLFWILGAVVMLGTGAITGWYLWPRSARPPVLKLDGVDPRIASELRQAREAVLAEPRSAAAWGELGGLLFANDFYPESLECLRQAERLEPREQRWPYLQGLVLLLSDPDEAVAPLIRASRLDPDAITPRLRLAETLLGRDELDEAETQFQAVRDLDPDNARALLGLGQLAQRRDRWKESIPLLKRAVDSPFARKAAHTALAMAHLRLDDPESAERHRREADDAPRDLAWPDAYFAFIDEKRVSLPARIDRADRLLAQSQLGPAVQLLQQILEEHPRSDEARLKLAQAFIRAGQPALAEKELEVLVAQHPNQPDGRFLLGMLLLQRNKSRSAEDEFRRAIDLRANFALAYFNLGRCLQQQGKNEQARKAYQDALRYRPHLVIGHVALARLLRQQGDRVAAREHLQQALRLQPDEPEAKKMLEEEK